MLVYFFLAASVSLQLAAAVLAFRLIHVTGRQLAWILVSVALFLMAIRRFLPLFYTVIGQPVWLDPIYEGIGLLLSACMLGGVMLIRPIFERIFESERELEESERRFRSYFELPIVGTAIISPDGRWATANDRVCEILGVSRRELIGAGADERSWPEDRDRESELRRRVIEGAADGYSLDKRFAQAPGGRPVWVNQAIRCVRDGSGRIDYFVTVIQDIAERKAYEEELRGSMREKEVLLRELYHRTKNNMQVICSLLNLESSSSGDPRLVAEFRDIENRIRSMSLVHEKLYQSRDLSSIELAEYLEDLASLIVDSYSPDGRRIALRTSLGRLRVPIDTAIPCGLIVNELVTNSMKYAFPAGSSGTVFLGLEPSGDGLARLLVTDDGIGAELGEDGLCSGAKGIGLKTVHALAAQLGGEARRERGQGMRWTIRFPTPKAEHQALASAI
jgi:PAS domain S-box